MSTQFDDVLGGEEPPAAKPLRFVNAPADTPTVYADTCMFAIDMTGTVRLQFAEAVAGALDSQDPGTKMRYVGTLVMPLAGFNNMIEYLNRSLGEGSDGK